MERWFTIGALALADRRANAVGAVRLCCAPDALEIDLVRAASFSEGFAPGEVVDSVRLRVPYLAVRGLVRRGRTLHLSIDPAVSSPYNRFALARFTEDPAEVLAQAYKARARARWASYLVPWPLGALIAVITPDAWVSGALGRASLGLVIALLCWAVLREIVAWRSWGGPISDRYCDELELELSQRLGLSPEMSVPIATRPLAQDAISASAEPSLLSPGRLRLAMVVTFAAIGVVAFMAFLQRFTEPVRPPPAVPLLVSGLDRAIARTRPGDSVFAPPPAGPRCICVRADSPLWKKGMPELSILRFVGEGGVAGEIAPQPGRGGKMRFDFDLAVVNNAAHLQHDVRLTLTFARRDERGERAGVVDRGLFWEGALGPARAVKWHVKAPGTEMRIDTSVEGTLEDKGIEPASPDAFAALAAAHYRPVRLHAAIMLAYLRDRRALEMARAFSAQNEDERSVLDRIARAAAPLFACAIERVEESVRACVFNGSSREIHGAELRDLGTGRRFPIEGIIPVHEGALVSFPVEGEMGDDWEVAETQVVQTK